MSNLTIIPSDFKCSTTITVDLAHLTQAVQMVTTFQSAYDAEGKVDHAEVLAITKKNSNYAVIGTETRNIKKTTQEVSVSIDQLQNLIQAAVGIGTENPDMFATAAKAFLNLNAQQNGSYFNILSQTTDSIRYRYNIFNVTQNKSTGALMKGVIASVDIQMWGKNVNFLALTRGSVTNVQIDFKSITIVEPLPTLSPQPLD
ncbi:type-2Aa cytolytic delta-endotoxin [Microcystis aeruginosa LEGE 11464]|uniref:type-2Aa cytolytic delta-endotoxin n=1 Tax=Microcystis aeruginosa TaxID=1126 RepID=UPI00187EE639|nr:type-2Aa cytolytic delta-endotoxin [Microcystis aeruginosa]MBE9088490.1 type-2Aa cytolytic delta-endotoxin [Microcystis aeruginosa LEGE 11464]